MADTMNIGNRQTQSNPSERGRSLRARLGDISGVDRFEMEMHEHPEGRITRRIEDQTARIPSGTFLSMAIGSMALSLGLSFFGRRRDYANFVGLWVPTFLLFGIYNKIVKVQGSDQMDVEHRQHRAA